jgi:predicted DNA-binding transcriptional regulator AlpA
MKLLTANATADRLGGISQSSLARVRKRDPEFPPAIRLTPNGRPRFREDLIDAYIGAKSRGA